MIVATITSAYYAKEFIESKLLNLAMSTAEIYPVIVCQEGSYEHNIAKSYVFKAKWNHPPRIITTQNIPPLYTAWNIAVKNFTADYYITANTDDTFAIKGIQHLVNRITETGADICYGSIAFKNKNSIKIYKARQTSLKMLKRRCYLTPFPIWRAEMHQRFGYFDESFFVRGDHEFWLRCVNGGATISCTTELIGQFLWRKTNLESRYHDVSEEEIKRIHEMYPA